MKRLFYSIFALASLGLSIETSAQCTPDVTNTEVISNPAGATVSGDTVWLPMLNGPGYSSIFHFNIPGQIPYNGTSANVNYFKVNSLTGLPEGLSYACSAGSDCNYNGGEQGCMEVSGDPTTAVTPNTTYILDFKYEASVSLGSINATLNETQLADIPEIGTRIFAIKTGSAVGLEELGLSADVKIYPNPTKGSSVLELNTENESKFTISVVDIQGQILNQFNQDVFVGINKIDLNTTNFAPGVYQIVMSNSKGHHSMKLIIE